MIRSCVTISLVSEARGGPFVFWDDLEAGCQAAADLGFDAVEIFPPSPTRIDVDALKALLARHNLRLAAVGTGAGWVLHHLNLTHADATVRQRAATYIRSIIDVAGAFGASAIIGSMQGRWADGVNRERALGLLGEALNELGQHADQYGAPLLYEPLNRYETNLVNTVADGVKLLQSLRTSNVKLLCDLFHMNIEEVDIAAALRAGAGHVGHIHFVDSNRRAVGMGHIDFTPIAAALQEIGYDGYVSAEALALPDSQAAAAATIAAYKKYFPKSH